MEVVVLVFVGLDEVENTNELFSVISYFNDGKWGKNFFYSGIKWLFMFFLKFRDYLIKNKLVEEIFR